MKQFMHDIYRILAQDHGFVEMLHSEWDIELSANMLYLYRFYVMYRQPLIRIDSGYHIPSSEEVIAGIRAYFDPIHLSDDAAPSAVCRSSDSEGIRAEVISIFQGFRSRSIKVYDLSDVQGHLLNSIKGYIAVLSTSELISSSAFASLLDRDSDFTVPLEVSEALSRVSTLSDIKRIKTEDDCCISLLQYLFAWTGVHQCLEISNAGPACECPFVYFFVKFCLDQGAGVPKLALAAYDRMNMQLSREFIRCANPTCELNRLDQSTGHVKFKKCSRCHAVIYCSRECQVAHYPEHKRLCREHATSQEGS